MRNQSIVIPFSAKGPSGLSNMRKQLIDSAQLEDVKPNVKRCPTTTGIASHSFMPLTVEDIEYKVRVHAMSKPRNH